MLPIELLLSLIASAVKNEIEVLFSQEVFKQGLLAIVKEQLELQLELYKKQLPNQPNGVGGTIRSQTIHERDRGATDFVDFVLGVPRRGGARIRRRGPRR